MKKWKVLFGDYTGSNCAATNLNEEEAKKILDEVWKDIDSYTIAWVES